MTIKRTRRKRGGEKGKGWKALKAKMNVIGAVDQMKADVKERKELDEDIEDIFGSDEIKKIRNSLEKITTSSKYQGQDIFEIANLLLDKLDEIEDKGADINVKREFINDYFEAIEENMDAFSGGKRRRRRKSTKKKKRRRRRKSTKKKKRRRRRKSRK